MAKKITVDAKGLVRVNGIPVCEKKSQNGETVLYFKRKNNSRQRRIKGDGEAITLRDFITGINKND